MPKLSKNYVNLVALGALNPQILNFDFLRSNHILPEKASPFRELLQQDKPVKKFVSFPGFSNLLLANIEFLVDTQRFQIRETGIHEWTGTKVLDIVRRYFEVLRYTPLKVVGINLNSTAEFPDSNEETKISQALLPDNAKIRDILPSAEIEVDSTLVFPYPDNTARVKLSIQKPEQQKRKKFLNFNYEFDFKDWPQFNTHLDKFSEIAEHFDSILARLFEVK